MQAFNSSLAQQTNQNNSQTEGFKIGVTNAIDKLEEYFDEVWNGLILAAATAFDPRSQFVFVKNSNFQHQDIDVGRQTDSVPSLGRFSATWHTSSYGVSTYAISTRKRSGTPMYELHY